MRASEYAFTPSPRVENGGDSDDEEKLNQDEDIPLQDRVRIDDQRRKGTIMSRATSTKWSTLHGTESRTSRQNNGLVTSSRQREQEDGADWSAAAAYHIQGDQYACASTVGGIRQGTKSCLCKKCVESMADREKKRGFLMSWRERAEENSRSSSSSSRRRRDKDVHKRTKQSTRHLIRSPRSFADEGQSSGIEKLPFSSM
ncbi:hypothetical protein LSH36_5g13019 [Paralvinella palmiformis]|uniref:Uncharacterized protein n=1 Tax=Paralvinella palmiformis TaxID=53620 RepID=A0AAD9KE67_9ANNE|nr:hypothetical protein LSH36_5g13019 [Paralvinella palmiformis]